MKNIFALLLLVSSVVYGKNVLVIGDSMAEAIDRPIKKIFQNNEIDCKVSFKRGTRVDYWLKNKDLYMNEPTRPDVVIISLTTNDIVANKSHEKIINELEALIENLIILGADKKNILIVATPIEEDRGLNQVLIKHFGKQVFDSKEVSLAFGKDKIHPTMQSNVVWAAAIVDYIATNNPFMSTLKKTKSKTLVSMK